MYRQCTIGITDFEHDLWPNTMSKTKSLKDRRSVQKHKIVHQSERFNRIMLKFKWQLLKMIAKHSKILSTDRTRGKMMKPYSSDNLRKGVLGSTLNPSSTGRKVQFRKLIRRTHAIHSVFDHKANSVCVVNCRFLTTKIIGADCDTKFEKSCLEYCRDLNNVFTERKDK
ncbi:hypothetical protein Bhyg_08048 [Pseudolycoriella hygida]|uniref:Uncharacterized protein n=1 Tax=Pseudolycoriella hygida TaxID=35572 RepID=A0A9Q0S2L2_9DIPT|nr:hypothetical protein Bhyg_08048 [Pseudolycoriella hygida]